MTTQIANQKSTSHKNAVLPEGCLPPLKKDTQKTPALTKPQKAVETWIKGLRSVEQSKTIDTTVEPPKIFTDGTIQQNTFKNLEHGKLEKVKALVLHRTAGSSAASALDGYEKGEEAGTHFLIDKDGTIYQTASLDQWTKHVGKIRARCETTQSCSAEESKLLKKFQPTTIHNLENAKDYPKRYPTNADSIGIEVVGKFNETTKDYEPATPEQVKSLNRLVDGLSQKYNLTPQDVYLHGVISYKQPTEGSQLGY